MIAILIAIWVCIIAIRVPLGRHPCLPAACAAIASVRNLIIAIVKYNSYCNLIIAIVT